MPPILMILGINIIIRNNTAKIEFSEKSCPCDTNKNRKYSGEILVNFDQSFYITLQSRLSFC